MKDRISYSSNRIRKIRNDCLDLIAGMEQRLDEIARIAGEDPSELRQAVVCYKEQMEHLHAAADLYDRCTAKAAAEVEEALKRGGA